MLSDLRYTLRQLARRPSFTAAVVLILGLGIGANTAIFTLIHSIFLITLPVPQPQQLFYLTDPNVHYRYLGVASNWGNRAELTYAEFRLLHDHDEVFSGLCATSAFNASAELRLENPGPKDVSGAVSVGMVSGDYFSVLGVQPFLGRFFGPEVDRALNAHPVAVLNYRHWIGRLGGDPAVIGKSLRIGKTLYQIVGIAAPDFMGDTDGMGPAVWVPLTMQADVYPGPDLLSEEKAPIGKAMWLQVLGRLKPGEAPIQAQVAMDAILQGYLRHQVPLVPAEFHDDFLNQHIKLTPGTHGGSVMRSANQEPLTILMILVALLLLIACANLATLLLARTSSRRREIAIRIALGAGTSRIFRQLLVESLLLAFIGGGLGLLVAYWGDAILLQLLGVRLVLQPSTGVLLFTLGVSIFVGLLFGTLPALQASRLSFNAALKGAPESFQIGRLAPGRAFVVLQVAVSLLLLIVAGFFVRSLYNLASVETGFDRDHLVEFFADAPTNGFPSTAVGALYERIAERIRAVPGVKAASFSFGGLLGTGNFDHISIEGLPFSAGQDPGCGWDMVAPGYFETVGMPILLGRGITAQDGRGQRVGVINRTMAQYYFGDANPIGRRVIDHYAGPIPNYDFIIVGVAADAKYYSMRETPLRRFYVPYHNPIGDVSFAAFEIRAAGRPDALLPAIQGAVKDVAPALTISGLRTMNQVIDQSFRFDRLLGKLSSFFGILGALLVSTGIYGSLAYMVACRTREIGIRMALGARHGDVLWLVLGDALLLVLIGVAIAVPASWGASRLLSSILFGVSSMDPLVFGSAASLLLFVALAAGYGPSRRATRVDPLVALREE